MFRIFIKPSHPFTQAWHFHSSQDKLAHALMLVGQIESRINHPPHAIKIEKPDGDLIFNWSRSDNHHRFARKVVA